MLFEHFNLQRLLSIGTSCSFRALLATLDYMCAFGDRTSVSCNLRALTSTRLPCKNVKLYWPTRWFIGPFCLGLGLTLGYPRDPSYGRGRGVRGMMGLDGRHCQSGLQIRSGGRVRMSGSGRPPLLSRTGGRRRADGGGQPPTPPTEDGRRG